MAQQEATGWTGWVLFASLLLMFDGILQVIYGLGALFHGNWYVATDTGTYVFSLSTWGWVYILVGILLFISGMMLMNGNWFGRTMGVVFVVLGLLANLAFIAVSPVWSIIAIIAYGFTAYAILFHGGEMRQLQE
jgi:hypothetical protein